MTRVEHNAETPEERAHRYARYAGYMVFVGDTFWPCEDVASMLLDRSPAPTRWAPKRWRGKGAPQS